MGGIILIRTSNIEHTHIHIYFKIYIKILNYIFIKLLVNKIINIAKAWKVIK